MKNLKSDCDSRWMAENHRRSMKLNEKGSESHDSLEAEYPSMQNIGTLLSYLNVYLH
jgi:hypothetical protein